MSISTRNKKISLENSNDFIFQIIDWYPVDFEDIEEDEQEDEIEVLKYMIKAFGVTEEGHSVSVNIENYKPYFYIGIESINRTLRIKDKDTIKSHLMSLLPKKLKRYISDINIVDRKKLYGSLIQFEWAEACNPRAVLQTECENAKRQLNSEGGFAHASDLPDLDWDVGCSFKRGSREILGNGK